MAITRFAPSPTGRLHVGNIRTALINWVVARQSGGSFILRLDDTDAERSTDAFAEGIREDMAWLGLTWDKEARQSERFDRYEEARWKLVEQGRLYPCYETPQELETQRSLQRARGLPPVYDRSARSLTPPERTALENAGRRPHWRFLLGNESIAFDDLIRGPVAFEPGHVSDPVLVREDGVPTYTLASVVDDMDMDVTHVIRGEDHVSNTAVQIELIAALGGTPITFGHHPLLTAAEGEGLSKRTGGGAVADLREEGVEPMALVSYLARLGTSLPIEPFYDVEDIVRTFDFATISRNPPRYDPADVSALNQKWLHGAPYAAVADALGDLDPAFWNLVRGNVGHAREARDWWRICNEAITPVLGDAEFAARAADVLPAEPWDDATWKTWTQAVKETTGRKGRELFMPLRLALTGLDHGPELAGLLPRMGLERVKARLAGQEA
ncbi:MAG: glutamate--tRNA ligase [Alphaproteobacteria bacterium]|jgi:glutamyl-tRNA synthetase